MNKKTRQKRNNWLKGSTLDSYHPLYAKYVKIMTSAYCPDTKPYRMAQKDVAEVGLIKVHPRWHLFDNFVADVQARPSPELGHIVRPDLTKCFGPDNFKWVANAMAFYVKTAKSISPDKKQEIIRLRSLSMRTEVIAEQVGVHRSTVGKVLREADKVSK